MELLFSLYRILFAKKYFRRFNYAILRFGLTGLGILNYKNIRSSGEYYLINNILKKLVTNKNPVFFDVGANIGSFSVLLLERFPHATIHAFEPHPRNYEQLLTNISSTKIKCHNIALGEKNDTILLFDQDQNSGTTYASIFQEVITEIHKQPAQSYPIPIRSLDTFMKEEGIQFIDYLKIDTEGNDLSVLAGATTMLKSGKIGFIHFEFNEMNIISRVYLRDFKRILNEYHLYRLLPHDLLLLNDNIIQTEIFGYQNIFAVPKKLSNLI